MAQSVHNETLDSIARGIKREESRNIRRINQLRLYMTSMFFALQIVLGEIVDHPDWQMEIHTFAGYWAICVLMFIVGRRVESWLPWLRYAVPVIDAPMIFLLLFASMESGSARGTAGFAVGIFSLLILLSSFGLVRSLIIVTACSCTLFEILLQAHSGVSVGAMVAAAVVMALVAASCIFLVDRFKKLTRTIASEQLRAERMGRYFSPQVASLMNANKASEVTGKSHEITVLFCDIRGFTAMTEALGNEEVVGLLNDYFTTMVDVVFEFGGTLDKFMGDGILAYFGAPVVHSDHADRAILCAQSMQKAIGQENLKKKASGEPGLEAVIVVHSGPAILGSIGSDKRREFTAIGKTVNVAARMEAVAKEREVKILVSHACKQRVQKDFCWNELSPAKLRSVPEPVRCYSLGASQDGDR